MAYSSILDEKYGGGLFAEPAGYFDVADSLYDIYKAKGQLVEDTIAYGELTSANSLLLRDNDFYDFGNLSTGIYRVDVDDYTWDSSNIDLFSVASFTVYDGSGLAVDTSYNMFSDIEFTVESGGNYYLGIEGPLSFDAQYSATYSKIGELVTTVNYPAVFSNPVFAGDLISGSEITLGVAFVDLNLVDPDGLTLWGLYTADDKINPVATSFDSTFILGEDLVGEDLYFRAFFYDLDGFAELSDAFSLGTVLAPNNPPVLDTVDSLTVAQDTKSDEVAFSATDADGDTLSFSFSNPDKGRIIDNGNNTYSYLPYSDATGSDSFTVTVNDGTVDASQTVDVTINPLIDTSTTVIDKTFIVVLDDFPERIHDYNKYNLI